MTTETTHAADRITTTRLGDITFEGRTVGFYAQRSAGHLDVFITVRHGSDDIVVVHNKATGAKFNSTQAQAGEALLTAANNEVTAGQQRAYRRSIEAAAA